MKHGVRLTLGILAPRSIYCFGFLRKLTNSRISTLASSQPATSLERKQDEMRRSGFQKLT